MAPSKALVQEKLRHWSQKFESLGVNCLELTGDNESYNIRNIQDADIILTTPEVRMSLCLRQTCKIPGYISIVFILFFFHMIS